MSLLRWPVVVVAIVWSAQPLSAQRPSAPPVSTQSVTAPLAPSPLTKEQIENPPARDFAVEQLAEPLKRPLNRPQPSLVEQKFVATVQFLVAPVEGRNASAVESGSKLYELQRLVDGYFLSPSSNGSSRRSLLAEDLQRVIANVPEERLAKSEREFFRSAEVDIGFVTLSNNAQENWAARFSSPQVKAKDQKTIQEFRILGKTAAECEQRARALVTMFDLGFSRPLQLELLQMRNYQAEKYAERQRAYLELKESLPGLQKSLENYADLSNDMLTGLRLQQREAEIKLAGTKARLAAVEKLLAQAKGDGVRSTHLEDAKVSAAIEIADLDARQAKAVELVERVNTRIELSTKIEAAEKSIPLRAESLHSYLRQLSTIDRDLERHAPLPLVDNKIVIRPVEWTTP